MSHGVEPEKAARVSGQDDGWIFRRCGPGVPLLLVLEVPGGEKRGEGAGLLHDRIRARVGRPINLLLLRGDDRLVGDRDIYGLGGSVGETAGLLKRTIEELQPDTVLSLGEGLGGHAALVFGVLLGASRIVAIEPVSHLDAVELNLYNDRRWRRVLEKFADPSASGPYDVSLLIERHRFQGRAFILFGTKRWSGAPDVVHLNTIHAMRLARSERVTLCPFPEVVQDPLGDPDHRDDAEEHLIRLLFEEFPPSIAPPTAPVLHLETDRRERSPYDQPLITLCSPQARLVGKSVRFTAVGEVDPGATRRATDDWRRWIAENLLIEAPPDAIRKSLMMNGFSEKDATEEIDRATSNFYFRGARRLQDRLKKREWLLSAYRKLNRLDPHSAEVPRRYKLASDDFVAREYATHRPVVITGMLEGWPALRDWSLDELARRYGDREVELPPGSPGRPPSGEGRGVSGRPTRLSDYLASIHRPGPSAASWLTADDGTRNRVALAEIWEDIMPIPGYLNREECRSGAFDLCPVGALAPFRQELDGTIVAQVLGRSRVKLIPPWDLPLWDGTRPEIFPDRVEAAYPVESLPINRPQVLECDLFPGDLLFRPAGCWHSLEVLEAAAFFAFSRFASSSEIKS